MYEERDKDIIDYNMTDLLIGSESFRIREPLPEKFSKNKYAVCIGAAQTFGCFSEKPFPLLLNNSLDFPVINFSRGGASASSFNRTLLLDFLNNSGFVIIQIMSARGEENSSFRPTKRAGQKTAINKETGQKVLTKSFYNELFDSGRIDKIKENVSESRNNWIKNNIALLKSIQVPKILFWFSRRSPNYQEKYINIRKLYSSYPQLVNEVMVDTIKSYATEYIECISNKGTPQKLFSLGGDTPILYKRSGKILKDTNTYYPSPEMHIEAAKKLQPVCEKYISILKLL